MRRAVVHVGLPRTGTTTLQRVLYAARPLLLTQGILYPELTPGTASASHLSHQYLGEALDGRRPRRDRAELLGDLSRELAATDADIALLSYERLCLISPWLGVPQRLAALFARHGFAMELLVTVKPQDALLNSSYTWRTQFLREKRPFAAYFHADVGSPRLDLTRLLQGWIKASDGRVTAVPVLATRSGAPLLERIFQALGIQSRVAGCIAPVDLTLVENRSPGPVAVEVARRLREGGAHLALRGSSREVTRFVEDAARGRGLDTTPFMGLDATLRAVAAARWARANDRFARQVWGQDWSACVGDPLPSPCNEIAPADCPGHDVQEIIHETCERFRIRMAHRATLALQEAASSAASRLGALLRHGRAMTS